MDERIIELLENLLANFIIHDKCYDEIIELVVKKGILKKFVTLLQKNISYLNEFGIDVIKTENFEKLQGTTNLYSMKFKSSNMNLRLLYCYVDNKKIMLLCCFYERSDSIESYDKYIPIAERRLKEREERHV